MNSENRSRWQIRVATLSVFLLGFVAGALALNAYHIWASASQKMNKQQRYEQIFNQLNLTDAQRTDVQKITAETREELQKLREESEPRVQDIRNRSGERLQKVLTPEQWQKFQQLRSSMHDKHKKKDN